MSATRDVIFISDDDSEPENNEFANAMTGLHSASEPDPGHRHDNKHGVSRGEASRRAEKLPAMEEPILPLHGGRDALLKSGNIGAHSYVHNQLEHGRTIPAQPLSKTTRNDERNARSEHIRKKSTRFCDEDLSQTSAEARLQKRRMKPRKSPSRLDPIYGIKMYCGPGYEIFPIAFDTLPENSEERRRCHNFEANQERRSIRKRQKQIERDPVGPTDNRNGPRVSSSSEDEDHIASSIEHASCRQIIEILPDIDPEFVLRQVRAKHELQQTADSKLTNSLDLGELLTQILELPEYPKLKNRQQPLSEYEEQTGRTISWDKTTSSQGTYTDDVVDLLQLVFQETSSDSIRRALGEKNSLYDAYILLKEKKCASSTDAETSSRRHKYHGKNPINCLQMDPWRRDVIYYANLVNELQAAKQEVARRELRSMQEQKLKEEEDSNLAEYVANGQVVECSCCFDDKIALNRAVSCHAEPMHWFCFECIRSFVGSVVGQQQHHVRCMATTGCQESLTLNDISRAVSKDLFGRLMLNQQQAEIAAAGLDGLDECPFCEFKAVCDPVEVEPLFSCRNPVCFTISCRKCKKQAHSKKSCQQAERDKGLDARHKVEEARSEAMMRACPKCKTKIIKELGCNKLRCNCGGIICYVCRKDLSHLPNAYTHFETFPGTGCVLNDISISVDAAHDREARQAEEKVIEAMRANDTEIDEDNLRIESSKPHLTASNQNTIDDDIARRFQVPGRVAPWIDAAPNLQAVNYDGAQLPHAPNHIILNPAAVTPAAQNLGVPGRIAQLPTPLDRAQQLHQQIRDQMRAEQERIIAQHQQMMQQANARMAQMRQQNQAHQGHVFPNLQRPDRLAPGLGIHPPLPNPGFAPWPPRPADRRPGQ